MKLCMIGCRGHNGYVLAGLPRRPHVKIVGVCAGAPGDDGDGLRTWAGAGGHDAKLFDDYRHMLDELEPDTVSVAGPCELHAQMSIDAMDRGAAVFCEKPVATTLEDLERLRSACDRTGLHLAGMMGLRYDPAIFTAWRAVRDGAVGTVRMLTARKSYKLGRRPEYYHSRTHGGTIPWVGSHAVDWMLWFTAQRFLAVSAVHSSAHNRGNGELEMTALCQFAMTDEVLASASIDYLRPSTAATHGDDRIRVAGTAGVIEVRDGQVTLITDQAAGEQDLPCACDRQVFADFVDHVEGKTTALLSTAETLAVTEAVLLARQAADERRVVTFPTT